MDIWMMKEHGVQAFWNKLVSIPTFGVMCPAFITNSERGWKFLLLRFTICGNLLRYDSEQEAYTEFDLDPAPPFHFFWGVFVESLVSMRSRRSFTKEYKKD